MAALIIQTKCTCFVQDDQQDEIRGEAQHVVMELSRSRLSVAFFNGFNVFVSWLIDASSRPIRPRHLVGPRFIRFHLIAMH